MKANRKFIRDEEAVSPVIGVILMVAITVILAAVIAAFVFGMGGSLKKQYTVSATVSQTNSSSIDVVYQGGPDHNSVSYINVSVGTQSNVVSAVDPSVGQVLTYTNSDYVTTGRDHVVVSATFDDGTTQVILDTYV